MLGVARQFRRGLNVKSEKKKKQYILILSEPLASLETVCAIRSDEHCRRFGSSLNSVCCSRQ